MLCRRFREGSLFFLEKRRGVIDSVGVFSCAGEDSSGFFDHTMRLGLGVAITDSFMSVT